MPDYDLRGLSSRSFEQLIQALTAKILAPGIVVFGDGPDGAREATFEGAVPFPSSEAPWNGYLVVQAKFCQSPRGGVEDTEWLLGQLRNELAKYRDRKRRLRTPEYYILATNIYLTAVANAGGMDRCTNELSQHARALGIHDFRIWDGNHIRTFLDNAEDLRRAYAAWITPGDVLAKLLQSLEEASPDFESTLAIFLQKELLADNFVNLEQAGHSVEERTLLARVFVDLPVARERHVTPPPDTGRREVQRAVRMIVDAGNEKLDPKSTALIQESGLLAARKDPSAPERGRFVIVGGPDQGKTTVGQFVAQLYRLALLKARPSYTLSSDAYAALADIEQQCLNEQITPPVARRFPLRVVLSKFAAAFSQSTDHQLSILRYLADHIALRTDRTIAADEFRRWLAIYPWLLVLDGLDEVPASSNRNDVLKAVGDFLVDIAQENADILIVATTRPQGYNNDFSPQIYEHWWLTPLSPGEALRYARRLARERYRNDEERCARVVDRIQRAAEHAATQRLMQSPLQITILAALLDQIGQAPRDRWRLFLEYYGAIFRREMEKPIAAAAVLRDHRTDVDMIHRSVGLVLQALSEEKGGTDAHLSKAQLEQIVRGRLSSQGHEGKEIDELAARILEAAAERLVFLVGLEEGRIGFEVRSLQEFMAAEALATGDDHVLRARLRHLAKFVNWRNVLLFFAGRCFAEREYLSEVIIAVCAGMNDSGNEATLGITRAGSRLALELLEDGSVRTRPKVARLLAREALCLLQLPPEEAHERLGETYEAPLKSCYEEAVRSALDATIPMRIPGWLVLLVLVQRNVDWARELADAKWPTDAKLASEMIRRLGPYPVGESHPSRWWLVKLASVLPWLSPQDLLEVGHTVSRAQKGHVPNWLRDAVEISLYGGSGRSMRLLLMPKDERAARGGPGIAVSAVKSKEEWPLAFIKMPNPSSGWRSVIAAAEFVKDPCATHLADAVNAIAEATQNSIWQHRMIEWPWPLEAVCNFAESKDHLHALAGHIRDKALGDIQDWLVAEERWRKQGIAEEDFLWSCNSNLPFDANIGKIGAPHGAMRSISTSTALSDQIVRTFSRMPRGRHRSLFAKFMGMSMLGYAHGAQYGRHKQYELAERYEHAMVAEIIEQIDAEHFYLDIMLFVDNLKLFVERYADMLEQQIRTRRIYTLRPHTRLPEPERLFQPMQECLSRLLREKPEWTWLLCLIAPLALRGLTPTGVDTIHQVDLSELSEKEKASTITIKIVDGTLSKQDERHIQNRRVREEINQMVITFSELFNAVPGDKLPDVERFLQALWRTLDPGEDDIRRKVVVGLDNLVSRRKSDLLSADRWEALGFDRSLRMVGLLTNEGPVRA